ncbi:MAG: TetR/AcrR family transcriptional regulator [Chloroflexota bacterium]
MSPKPDVSAERIPQIIDAALGVFAVKGFNQATMSDVAKAAGLSKGTIYLYFNDKDDLIYSALLASLEQGFGNLALILDSEGEVKGQILKWVEEIASQMAESATHLSIGFEFYALANRRPDIRECLQKYFQQYRQLLGEVIQKGITQGEFQPVEADAVAVAIIALFEGLNVLWFTEPDDTSWLSLRTNTIKLLLDSIS